jgi:TorA maturation chaperone TorD
MTGQPAHTVMAEVAQSRAAIYGVLLRVFAHLPDGALLAEIQGETFRSFADSCCGPGGSGLNRGMDQIKSYCSSLTSLPEEHELNRLSVDRTRVLRATGDRGLKPPYESLYKGGPDRSGTFLSLKNAYRKAGLLPDETACEMPDFLCVQLDFMYQLILREIDEWSRGTDGTVILVEEEGFLREHLGSWVSTYCTEAGKYARTEFYRGFLTVLDDFITMETEYLRDVTSTSPENSSQ